MKGPFGMRLTRSRKATLQLVVGLVLAALTGLTVRHEVGAASAATARWGATRVVPVLTRAVAAGDQIRPDAVQDQEVPVALVPDAAVAPHPVGRTARVALVAGEIVLAERVAPDGVGGVAALVPPRTRALAVPVPDGGLVVRRGDRVDVLSGTAPGTTVAGGALVVDATDKAVTVAVPVADAPAVAAAVATGPVALALVPPG